MDWAGWFGYAATTHTPQHIIVNRLLLAAVFGGMIGFEREQAHRAAGLRTHIVIAMAAALFTMLALEIYAVALAGGANNPDPIRAVEATTAGIAFLGAGAIFQSRGNVWGLTTGAGMWFSGAVGMATGLGFYAVAFAGALLAIIVLALLRVFAHRIVGGGVSEGIAEDATKRRPGGGRTGKSGHT
jgi:putative Mg2+ transporter-C (MgtC) family protein